MDENKDKAMLLLSLDQVELLLGLAKKDFFDRREFLRLAGLPTDQDERVIQLRDIISQLGG